MAGEGRGEGGRTGDRMAKDKRSLHSHGGRGGGQYKMYKSIIFINFIIRSKS